MNVIGQSGVEVSHGFGSWRQVREVFGVAGKMNGSECDCGGSGSRDSTACGLPAIARINIRAMTPADSPRLYMRLRG